VPRKEGKGNQTLIDKIAVEEERGIFKWGETDKDSSILLNAATEKLGEVAHAINHNEGVRNIRQEIAETMGILSRLYDMVIYEDWSSR